MSWGKRVTAMLCRLSSRGLGTLEVNTECPRVNLSMAIAVMVPNQTVTSDGTEVQVLYIFFKLS